MAPLGNAAGNVQSTNQNSSLANNIQQNITGVNDETVFNQSSVFDEDDPRTWGNYPRKAEASEAHGLLANLTKWKNNIKSLISAISTVEGRKKASSAEVDIGHVSSALSLRIKQDTGIDIEAGFTHVLDGGHLFHILNRHGVGNEKLDHQLEVTQADLEMLPEVLRDPTDIKHGGKTRDGLNAIIMTRDFGDSLVAVEAIHNRKKKLSVVSVIKTRSGYDVEVDSNGKVVVKKKKPNPSGPTSETFPTNGRRQNDFDFVDNIPQNGGSVNSGQESYDQRVYHGTRHKIEDLKMRLDKIGIGEGHQAYGWGIYLAENPAVAREYMRAGSAGAEAKRLA